MEGGGAHGRARQAEAKEMGLIGWHGAVSEEYGEEEEVEQNNKGDVKWVCRCRRRGLVV